MPFGSACDVNEIFFSWVVGAVLALISLRLKFCGCEIFFRIFVISAVRAGLAVIGHFHVETEIV